MTANIVLNVATILDEVRAVAAAVDPLAADEFLDAIHAANSVFVTGQGRSGLIGRAFAMRLMHLGLTAFVVGETSTPAIGAGDLLVALSGTGATETTNRQVDRASEAGARCAILTAANQASAATIVVCLPARREVATTQHAGSLFEQASLIFLDAISLTLQQQLNLQDAALAARHANLQ